MRLISQELSDIRRTSGSLGGLATRERHSHEFYATNGRCGGRPRLKTLDELKREQPRENIFMEEIPYSLRELRRMFKKRDGAGAG